MKLSEHFLASEFACSCCNVSNVNPKLIAALEQLRAIVQKPINITSGYRCKKHNARTPGAAHNSQHTLGNAADIHVRGLSVVQLAAAALEVPDFKNGGIGQYPRNGFVHVDVRGSRARWRG